MVSNNRKDVGNQTIKPEKPKESYQHTTTESVGKDTVLYQ